MQSLTSRHPRGFALRFLSAACLRLLLLALPIAVFAGRAGAQGLQISFGSRGVQTLSYNGVVLENTASFPSDAFHIWHMQATDLSGNVISTGQYGWGENNNGESWNSQTNTETYTFCWGSISTQFVQQANNLDMIVTEVNDSGSGIIFDGAEIFPFALHFPKDPAGFYGYSQFAITTTDPGVSAADFGSGVVTSVVPNESIAMYGGWESAGPATYTPVMTTTSPSGLAVFYPHNNLPVQPGTSLTYTVSLRFTPKGTPAAASDAYQSFAAAYPSRMTWADKRILGTAYLASSPAGDGNITQPGGFPTNPRRYFNDATVDITTADGLQAFQDRILAQAASNVTNAQDMDAQGVITWDIEGEQYPQTTSYVCSPDQIAAAAPEMESTISDAASPYLGQKLDDAYFKIMLSAGLRTGVCIRPQAFTLASNGTASQVTLSGDAAIIANLENKARYANGRWGVTIFYVDSTVDANGGTLDPAIFEQLITDLPSFLFIPEESTTRYYAYSAPFYSFLDHTSLGTPAVIYQTYPKAFGANLVNDVSAATLALYTPQLTQSVVNGDILMGHADYWQPNDPTLAAIYKAAGVSAPPPSSPAPGVNDASGFSPGGLLLNGSAALDGSRLQLTNGTECQAASAYYPSQMNVQAFTTAFTFQLTRAEGDGFTFVIQGDGPSALGAYGSNLGYGGLGRSVAVKFDLHNNTGEGPNSTGLYLNGARPATPAIDLTPAGVDLHSGDILQVKMSYNGATHTVRITDTSTGAAATQSYTVNIPAIVGGNTAFAGFTGGTGDRTAIQEILNWTFTPGSD